MHSEFMCKLTTVLNMLENMNVEVVITWDFNNERDVFSGYVDINPTSGMLYLMMALEIYK